MIFSGTATCQSDKEMSGLLAVLAKYEIEPDIYGRRVLVEHILPNDADDMLKDLLSAFEQINIHGTCISQRR